jgi:hypothetical protein
MRTFSCLVLTKGEINRDVEALLLGIMIEETTTLLLPCPEGMMFLSMVIIWIIIDVLIMVLPLSLVLDRIITDLTIDVRIIGLMKELNTGQTVDMDLDLTMMIMILDLRTDTINGTMTRTLLGPIMIIMIQGKDFLLMDIGTMLIVGTITMSENHHLVTNHMGRKLHPLSPILVP